MVGFSTRVILEMIQTFVDGYETCDIINSTFIGRFTLCYSVSIMIEMYNSYFREYIKVDFVTKIGSIVSF